MYRLDGVRELDYIIKNIKKSIKNKSGTVYNAAVNLVNNIELLFNEELYIKIKPILISKILDMYSELIKQFYIYKESFVNIKFYIVFFINNNYLLKDGKYILGPKLEDIRRLAEECLKGRRLDFLRQLGVEQWDDLCTL